MKKIFSPPHFFLAAFIITMVVLKPLLSLYALVFGSNVASLNAFAPPRSLCGTGKATTVSPPGKAPPFYSYRVTVLQSMAVNDDDNHDGEITSAPTLEKKHKKKKFWITLWIHVLSVFVVTNYVRNSIWPAFLLAFPLKGWNLIHSLSNMAFAGGILTTTLLEWNISNKDSEFFPKLLKVESILVLPALTGSLLSGVAQSFHSYASLRHAPRHVKSAIHILLLFGLWWGLTDRKSQSKVERAMDEGTFDESSSMRQGRRVSNLVSCLFLVTLYSFMILKPGFNGWNEIGPSIFQKST